MKNSYRDVGDHGDDDVDDREYAWDDERLSKSQKRSSKRMQRHLNDGCSV
ncbi:hypothetical protein HUB98_20280 [Paenibacillus barcinonensis]|uniref:Uncharacterized protein n=1 Tax=Paenibacillus barcinonensis TaxID=198119 RepID=A0ABX6Q820_PAEBA|nr:hypothetical protein [Paenibacillus barcinonensis]QKS58348.1 hypothetical protein HUB98_20280 [Paenibacillus barcinonensis]